MAVDGSKNAALPLLAAAAALRRMVHLANVPANADAETMLVLLQQCGWSTARVAADPRSVVMMPGKRTPAAPAPEVAARIRASYYLVPALLRVHGRARLPWPGGCRIGDRGMEQHFAVYEGFGDRITVDDYGYQVEAGAQPTGTASLALPFRSRGATIAALLRAVVAGRPLRLGQPNLSPEVLSVVDALRAAGWACRVSESRLVTAPPSSTPDKAVRWTVPGDKIEAGTLACAVAATGGNAHIAGVCEEAVAPLITALRWLGVSAGIDGSTLIVDSPQDGKLSSHSLRAVASLAPGGLDADFEPPLMAVALTRPGVHLFSDAINSGRHGNLVPQLARLGADIHELSPTRCRFTGPQRLTGAGVEATDIRTGSALLIAGLTARGVTTLGGLEQLRRGHADLPGKLRVLGADICEVIP
ncbi:UDP-N-acetylglucosamine 1-carboxyvinyltransferase [Streptomyces sp. NRRL F-4489]|uniref:UDP-N-acetylglucosamine 1-carboxyvinyltransferase n=1 Tax=Streptomyces sp. NRRL F-4489 TaxID=1609095 RepID=UPI000748D838|nr:UDP-N-acetylglucosamine 1-carboxyvinyltransferase [Streptomyces sp. NRRL F-4489]